MMAVSKVTPTANSSTGKLIAAVRSRGTDCGPSVRKAASPHWARTKPKPVPPTASSKLSTNDCRAMRQRPEPSASLTAISLRRETARPSCRLVTFAPAINKTKTTAPNNIGKAVSALPNRYSRNGITATSQPALVSGNSSACRRANALISDCACSTVTLGLSRAIVRELCDPPRGVSARSIAEVINRSAPCGKFNSAGITPTIVLD